MSDANEHWRGESPDEGMTMHVHPLDDLIDHELTDDCVCVPLQDPVTRDDGSVGWVVVHHALDGRDNGSSPRSVDP